MLAAGSTIDLLTRLDIILSVGLVVDDAIVMVENVERHLVSGMIIGGRPGKNSPFPVPSGENAGESP